MKLAADSPIDKRQRGCINPLVLKKDGNVCKFKAAYLQAAYLQ